MLGLKSDVGCKRKLNEDFLGYSLNDEYSLYILCDGMGGHNAGEVASELAVSVIKDFVKNNIETLKKDVLGKAIGEANNKICELSSSSEILSGMGTTVVAALIYEDNILIANVGDSVCFGINSEKINKLTKDHSLVQQLVDAGTISEVQARNHPNKNIITRALGTSNEVVVDIFEFNKGEYDKYLLCSDGLTNEISEYEIFDILKEESDYTASCDKLVELAKDHGGRDNITVILFGGEKV